MLSIRRLFMCFVVFANLQARDCTAIASQGSWNCSIDAPLGQKLSWPGIPWNCWWQVFSSLFFVWYNESQQPLGNSSKSVKEQHKLILRTFKVGCAMCKERPPWQWSIYIMFLLVFLTMNPFHCHPSVFHVASMLTSRRYGFSILGRWLPAVGLQLP